MGQIAVSNSTGATTHSGAPASLSFSYNAASNTYSVVEGGRSQTFAPSNIDPTQSNSKITTYKRVSGNTTDFLSISTNGTATGQTKYVGAGFWQRQVNGSTSTNGYFDAFTYGVQTPQSSMPRSGAASFDVQMMGASTFVTNVSSVSGTGRLDADFGTGAIYTLINYQTTDLNSGATNFGGVMNATAMLSSGSNHFNGRVTFNTTEYGPTNEFHGSFYGPGAEEVGATFSAQGENSAIVGAIWGARNSKQLNQAGGLNTFGQAAFYPVQASNLAATLDANGKVASASTGNPIVARYHPDSLPDLMYRSATDVFAGPTPGSEIQGQGESYLSAPGGAESALAAGLIYRATGVNIGFDSYIYGIQAPVSAIPLTGKAFFNGGIRGGIMEPGAQPQTFSGPGKLTADLGAGTLTGSGTYQARVLNSSDLFHSHNATPDIVTDSGNWSTNATITSGKNAITGTLMLDGAKDYSGQFNANFYGKAGDQIGGTFALASGTGGRANGTLTAALDPVTTSSTQPLSAITGPTVMQAFSGIISYQYINHSGLYEDYHSDEFGSTSRGMTLNPSSTSSKLIVNSSLGEGVIAQFGDPDFSSTKSTAAMNVYVRDITNPANPYTEITELRNYIFDGQGGRIALTYSGFSEYIYTYRVPNDYHVIRDAFISYGRGTVADLMPHSGTGSYTGVAKGSAIIYDPDPSSIFKIAHVYNVDGSSSVQVDFASGAANGRISLSGLGVAGEPLRDFGTANFSGSVGSVTNFFPSTATFGTLQANSSAGPLQGNVLGYFYGPSAQELGGYFDFRYAEGQSQGFVRGGFATTGH